MLSWSAPTLPQLSAPRELLLETNTTTTNPGMVLTLDQQSWVASLLNFGAFTAGPITGTLIINTYVKFFEFDFEFCLLE